MATEWQTVPVEPTMEMIDAGHVALSEGDGSEADALDCYRAMLASVPDAPAQEPVAYLYEHGGMTRDAVNTATVVPAYRRWTECIEPWNETPLYADPPASAVNAPRVKALEWTLRDIWASASSGTSSYDLRQFAGGSWLIYRNGVEIGEANDRDEAVAFADADYERRVRACLVGEPVAAGWQAIESAPKDGGLIIVGALNAHGFWCAEVWSPKSLAENNEKILSGTLTGSPHLIWEPTHWMPLPAAPREG